ncbi:hypothetical protein CAOG_06513 [Capsaspora owczarzaki ATCC 30864]|uniref:MAU2 chromatid cohesion factor homolog n=1 Tax=Capsaspora owczarzaki (strain ATCC 30864) TaxID=595528 RepID=A0A0D2WVF7_CAPO3|nr:hypothetical protein CAOG_06513 [Capsaspora owczarzaki ATCC 30864]KJE96148.1 hypothetical protein CAOG_006513 [Capsaspora owczarzaki ATCC 30864]|eukprot:XP_004345262.1 hypothetical protein CAOG_06513 [Capsaspora owczarzaki ATCC 30864]
MALSVDNACQALVALAEQSRSVGNIAAAIKCLTAAVDAHPSPRLEVRIRLELGSLLAQHGDDETLETARMHLERVLLTSTSMSGVDEVRFRATLVLADLYCQADPSGRLARNILRPALDASLGFLDWNFCLLFASAELAAEQGAVDEAVQFLETGLERARQHELVQAEVLFALAQFQLRLAATHRSCRDFCQSEAALLAQSEQLLQSSRSLAELNPSLPLYAVALTVLMHLRSGSYRNATAFLPELSTLAYAVQQQDADSSAHASTRMMPFSSELLRNKPLESTQHGQMLQFRFLPDSQLQALVAIIQLACAVQGSDHAEVDRLAKQVSSFGFSESAATHASLRSRRSLSAQLLEFLYLELLVSVQITTLNAAELGNNISEITTLCESSPRLLRCTGDVLATLLGLYSLLLRRTTAAQGQLRAALAQSSRYELGVIVKANIVALLLSRGHAAAVDPELRALLDELDADSYLLPQSLLEVDSTARQPDVFAAVQCYVKAAVAFSESRIHEARELLTQCLVLADESGSPPHLVIAVRVLLGKVDVQMQEPGDELSRTLASVNSAATLAGNVLLVQECLEAQRESALRRNDLATELKHTASASMLTADIEKRRSEAARQPAMERAKWVYKTSDLRNQTAQSLARVQPLPRTAPADDMLLA